MRKEPTNYEKLGTMLLTIAKNHKHTGEAIFQLIVPTAYRMPQNSPYDFECRKRAKIEVKFSTLQNIHENKFGNYQWANFSAQQRRTANGFVLIGYNWDKETLVYYDVPQEVIRKIVRDGGSI